MSSCDDFWMNNAKKYLAILNCFEINKMRMITTQLIDLNQFKKEDKLLDFINALVKENEQCIDMFLFIKTYPEKEMLKSILYTALYIIDKNLELLNKKEEMRIGGILLKEN